MRSTDTFLLRSAALLAVAAIAQASTWIVDINNGPGAHFTQLGDAVVASQPGDVILVRPGTYLPLTGAFTINKGITIVGQGTVSLSPPFYNGDDVDIRNVPAGETVAIANLSGAGWLLVNNQGSVTICESTAYYRTTINSCADVRLQSMSGQMRNVSVDHSRVEIASCSIRGAPGHNGQSCNSWWAATDGETAFYAANGSLVHLARTSATGGRGGNDSFPGDGGMGGYVQNSTIWIDGGGVSTFKGGEGGLADWCVTQFDGACGHALLLVNSTVIRSGATFLPTPAPYPPPWGGAPGGGLVLQNSVDQALTPDSPTLTFDRAPGASRGFLFTVQAPPGWVVRLNLGTDPQLLPTPGIQVENLLVKTLSYDLGISPPSGQVSKRVLLSPASALGGRVFGQAQLVSLATGEIRRTASAMAVVR